MRIARWDLWHDVSLQNYTLTNTTLDYNHYSYAATVWNVRLFYGCIHDPERAGYSIPCPAYRGFSNYFFNESFREEMLKKCMANIVVPISQESATDIFSRLKKLKEALGEGFDVMYLYPEREACVNCSTSAGLCGSNSTDEFICHFFNQEITAGIEHSDPVRLLIGIYAAAAGLLAFCIIAISFRRLTRIKPSNKMTPACLQKTKMDRLEVLIADYGSLAPNRYRYSDIKKMTHAIREKLDEGAYGCIYKGSPPCGRAVAVKILNRTKGKDEEFINEVTVISRSSHVNIVSLLEFCLEGHQRALVFELMVNKSLEKFISDEDASNAFQRLRWRKFHQIAIVTARILHFDIKPHNILLNEKFFSKISDFGMAKIRTKQESIISMKDARGTVGYIAPEVLRRNFGVTWDYVVT